MDLSCFACKKCRESSLRLSENGASVVCESCGRSIPYKNSVIDFVEGDQDTALDVEWYDLSKQAYIEHAQSIFEYLKSVGEKFLSNELGSVIEIGAGTGLLTVPLLTNSKFSRAVITDISPNMLAVIQPRLAHLSADKLNNVFYATYDAGNKVFADNSFDLCVGSSVLHHILDCENFFILMHRFLKPAGKAVFTEPGGAFHWALLHAMSDALEKFKDDKTYVYDFNIVAEWVLDTRFRILNSGDAVLAHMEDKHIFWRDDLEKSLRKSGFDVFIAPLWPDEFGDRAAKSYLTDIGVSSAFLEIFIPHYQSLAAKYFDDLDYRDRSPTFFLGLTARERISDQPESYCSFVTPATLKDEDLKGNLGLLDDWLEINKRRVRDFNRPTLLSSCKKIMTKIIRRIRRK